MKNNDLITRLKKNTAIVAVTALVVFGSIGVIAAILGRFLDEKLGTTPIFSLLILAVSYIIGWLTILKLRKEILSKLPKSKEE